MSLAVDGALLDGDRVGLRAEEGRIAELGPEVTPQDTDEVLDGTGMHLLPGFVNGHTHAAMTLFRNRGDELPLMRWLREAIWPLEARLEPEDVYWGTRLACLEMIRSGTVRFWDMYWHPGAAARAVEDAGLRATVAPPLIDAGAEQPPLPESALRSLDELDQRGDRIGVALAPHAIYTVSQDGLRWVAETSAERDLPIEIHLSETEDEVRDCLDEHGLRPAAYLDSVGVLGPRTVLAHGVWLDEEELVLIAERGATVVSNPVANLKLAVGGVFPDPAARSAGVQVGIGTDGPGSNNSLDLLSEVKTFALLQKHRARDPAVVPAREAWALATGRLSPLLGGEASIAVGQAADFLLLRSHTPELELGDFTAGLVYAASGSVVDTTVVNGRVLMRGGAVDGEAEVLARAVERAHGLGLAG
jgi:5-methylthioadenosine/S-adenosylhomocysteine deaminase